MTLKIATAALALVPGALAAPPGDANERQATTTGLGDAFERSATPIGDLTTPVPADAHERSESTVTRHAILVGSSGFDWRDAAIGALSGMGVAFLAGGLLLVALGRRTGTRLAMR